MNYNTLNQLIIKPGQCVALKYPEGVNPALLISQLIRARQVPVVLIAPDASAAQLLAEELRFFLPSTELIFFPDQETLIYDRIKPNRDVTAMRLTALARMPALSTGVIITAVNTCMQLLPPPAVLAKTNFSIAKGQQLSLVKLRANLVATAYYEVREVQQYGEFAVRGSIIDVFPVGAAAPLRIDFCDDQIESIRTFDPETQLSTGKIAHLDVLASSIVPFDAAGIECFRRSFRARFPHNPLQLGIYKEVTQGFMRPGIEYYLPLFCPDTTTFFAYVPPDSLIITLGSFAQLSSDFWASLASRYQESVVGPDPILPPAELFADPHRCLDQLALHPWVQVAHTPAAESIAITGMAPAPDLWVQRDAGQQLRHYCANQAATRILFSVSSPHHKALLWQAVPGGQPQDYATWDDFISQDAGYGVTNIALRKGCYLPNEQLLILTEQELFEHYHQSVPHKVRKKQQAATTGIPLHDLELGDPVIHVNYGVGRYAGLTTITANGMLGEFVCLEYAKGDKLYVPILSIELINKYIGLNNDAAPLHSLSNGKWQASKARVLAQLKDVAAELLAIYSKRAVHKKTPLTVPEQEYLKFAADFPFVPTVDQDTAIAAVLVDLQHEAPMDRVVCGDVGFGKTEVAMRAAFVASYNGLQVCVLVPTTLLAQQHYQTFMDRFANCPVNIAVLSRLTTPVARQRLLADVAAGRIDIIIGTHALLQASVKFAKLGLVIIDEEHLFGVKDKERLKKLRADVDLLTLTATPIPRTLQMSLAKIRDLSIMATPPARRLAIKTIVQESSPGLVREAIQRELLRGGQVFFVHNDIGNINTIATALQHDFPTIRVGVAHGQLSKTALEQVMIDFKRQRLQVLVCTTIIESGIDIPNANTIIINNAERFGLAQLYQLRGRVGRAHQQAYAYLMISSYQLLSTTAQQRLMALAELNELGSGFTLATYDLEIRGAGALLGEQQSGNMQEIGLSLYHDLLERAVAAIGHGETAVAGPDMAELMIDLKVPALIPETYVHDIALRLDLYKRLSGIKAMAALEKFQVELIDRFGLLPQPVKDLVTTQALKIMMQHLGAEYLVVGNGATEAKLQFGGGQQLNVAQLLTLIAAKPQRYQLGRDESIKLLLPAHHAAQRGDILLEYLEDLWPIEVRQIS